MYNMHRYTRYNIALVLSVKYKLDTKIDATELILPLISVWVTVYILIILIKVHFLAPSIYGEQILINESSSDEEESEEEDDVLLRI